LSTEQILGQKSKILYESR